MKRVYTNMAVAITLATTGMPLSSQARSPRNTYSVPVRQISGILVSASPLLGMPSRMAVAGHRLIVSDRSGDPSIHVIDLRTKEIVRSFGRPGRGPGDLQTVAQLGNVPGSPSLIWVYDFDLSRINIFNMDAPRGSGFVRYRDLVGTGVWFGFVGLLQRDSIVMGVESDTAMIAVADSLNRAKAIRSVVPGDPSVPVRERSRAYIAHITVNWQRSLVAMGYSRAGRLEIRDLRGQVVQARVPSAFEPVFVPDERKPGKPLRFESLTGQLRAYTDMVSTSDYIFALFCGEDAERFSTARDVHVFTWNGELVTVLRLDYYATGIVIDAAARYLYAAHNRPEPSIRAYDLSTVLRR